MCRVSELSPVWGRRLYEGLDADRRLAELSLRAEYLRNALARGDELRRQCSPLHPRTYPGQVMWAETVAELRRQLIPSSGDWACGSINNYETVFSSRSEIAIAVVGGDSYTGVRGFEDPSVQRKRGPVTRKRVQRNLVAQATLPFLGPDIKDLADEERASTWFLLVHARSGRLYQELSLPVSMDEDSRVTRWAERILLEPLDRDGAVTPVPDFDDSVEVPSVNVTRRD